MKHLKLKNKIKILMLLLTLVSCKKSNDVNPTPESPDTIPGECYCGDIVESYSKIYYPIGTFLFTKINLNKINN
jgi:hypothetical protein